MKKIHIISLVFLLGLFFFGCENDSILDWQNDEIILDETIPTVAYYIDDSPVSKAYFNDFENMQELPFVIYSGRNNEKAVYVYTNEKDYIAYGEKYGINLKAQQKFINHMQSYAQEMGIIEEYEKTGIVSDSYYEYQNETYNRIMGNAPKTVLTEFCKGYSGNGSTVYMAQNFPVMPPTWDRQVSSVRFVGAWGVVTLCTKRFFFGSKKTIDGPGFEYFNLYGSWNNATRSAIKAW